MTNEIVTEHLVTPPPISCTKEITASACNGRLKAGCDEQAEQHAHKTKNLQRTTFNIERCKAQAMEEAVFEIFSEAFQTHNPAETMFSFNGGKDCTAVLHMLCKYLQQVRTLQNTRLPVLYIQSKDTFDEIEEFVEQCAVNYNIELIREKGSIKQVLQQFCTERPHIKMVVMGCRRTDPGCANLKTLQLTDPGWPTLLRVNPILDWSCVDVWNYILAYRVPYCSLYDRGYTSIGLASKTKPNPHLQQVDMKTGAVTYRPAYELLEDSLERDGRVENATNGGSSSSSQADTQPATTTSHTNCNGHAKITH